VGCESNSATGVTRIGQPVHGSLVFMQTQYLTIDEEATLVRHAQKRTAIQQSGMAVDV
jgi:hypothetical protein